MTPKEERLQRLTGMLREAVDRHHAAHGTTAPPADGVRALNVTMDHLSVDFPVMGPDRRCLLGMGAVDDVVKDVDVARIVERATMWQRWHVRVAEIAKELPAEIARLTRGTDVEIVEIAGTGVSGTADKVTVHHHVDVRQLDGSLRHCLARWSIERIETDDGQGSWELRENTALIPNQRRLSRLLKEADGKPTIMVERTLARRLLAMTGWHERNDASKRLFAAAHGQVGTKVPWRSITLLEAREGRIVATVPLSDKARVRDDRITVKGAILPQTVVTALRGRPVETVVEHALLAGRTIRNARSGPAGTVVELERDDVDMTELRRELEGED